MERWDKEPEDTLAGRASEFWSGLRVPLPAPSRCSRLDVLDSSSGAAPAVVVVEVVLLGSVSGKWWHIASECDDEGKDCLGFKISKEGGEAE